MTLNKDRKHAPRATMKFDTVTCKLLISLSTALNSCAEILGEIVSCQSSSAVTDDVDGIPHLTESYSAAVIDH